MPRPKPTDETLRGRILSRSEPDARGCWIWFGTYSGPYGRLGLEGAHRVSFRVFRGPVTPGLYVCHRCDVPACVNPDHLFLGTPDENMQDKKRKGRSACGSRNGGGTKLHERDVPIIRALLAGGMSQASIGSRFGVSHRVIGRIGQGRTWRHVA